MLKSSRLLAMVLVVWRTWESGWGVWLRRGEVTDLRKEARVWRAPRTWTEDTPTGRVELRCSYIVKERTWTAEYHVEKARSFSCQTFLLLDCGFSFGVHGDVFGGSR
jgi:hypothetical protein